MANTNWDGSTGFSNVQNPAYYRTTTGTYERWKTRNNQRVHEFFGGLLKDNPRSPHEAKIAEAESRTALERIVYRLRKTHPELKGLQRLHYARNIDPLGRQVVRLQSQGVTNDQIIRRLKISPEGVQIGGGRKAASSGHSGG